MPKRFYLRCGRERRRVCGCRGRAGPHKVEEITSPFTERCISVRN
jgi:hypothetical protein